MFMQRTFSISKSMGFPEVWISIFLNNLQPQLQRTRSLCDLHTSKSGDEKGMTKTKEITDKVSAKKLKTTE
jgi:hypothetical protein